jgi:hypothetical protein
VVITDNLKHGGVGGDWPDVCRPGSGFEGGAGAPALNVKKGDEVMYCHRCAVKQGIDAGAYAGVAFEELPCAKCVLEESSQGTMAFDEDREDKMNCEGLGTPEVPPVEELPIGILGDALKLFLGMSNDELALVRGKFAGKFYAEIAAERQITAQAVEGRLRRIIDRNPLLAFVFPKKVRKRKMRQQLTRAGKGGVLVGKGGAATV